MTSWEAADVLAQEGGAEVEDEMTRLQIAGHARVLNAWQSQKDELPAEWAPVASLNDYALRLTPDQGRALARELNDVLTRWLEAHPAEQPTEGTELVSVLLDVLPLKEWPA